MIAILAVVMMVGCILATVGRTNVRMVPSAVSRNVTGVEPKKIYWEFETKRAIESITLDATYTPTGGTGAGDLNTLMLELRGYCNGQLKIGIRKNGWKPASKLSFRLFESDVGPRTNAASDAEKAFNDGTSTVGTSTFPYSGYYTIKGPFQPGKWKFVLDLDKVSNSWAAASGFTGDFSLNPRFYVGKQPKWFVVLFGSKRYADTEVTMPACHAYYLDAVANLDKIMHGPRNIQGTELIKLQYAWNQYMGKTWLGTMVTPGTPVVESDLGVYMQEGRVPVVAKYTTSSSIAYAYMISYALPAKSAKAAPAKRKESAEVAEVPWPNEDDNTED